MKARITELCHDPAVIAKLAQPEEVCQVSPDGGKTWIWLPVWIAALLGAGYVIRRKRKEENTDNQDNQENTNQQGNDESGSTNEEILSTTSSENTETTEHIQATN